MLSCVKECSVYRLVMLTKRALEMLSRMKRWLNHQTNRRDFPSWEAFMYREYKYLTAPQYALNMGVKYAFVLPSTRMKTYIALDFSHRHACDDNVFLVGKNHTVGRLTVGCTF